MRQIVLYLLNVLYALFGLILFIMGIIYCVYVNSFTALRNRDHYKLDFNLYWPQVIPIVACFAGLFVIFVSCCGCCSAYKNHRGFTIMQAIFTVITLIVLITSAALTLQYGDSAATDDYLKDALNDGASEAKTSANHRKMFSDIERWLECCGVDDFSGYRGYLINLPNSCCGFEDDSSETCTFISKQATSRRGCAPIVVTYSRIGLRALGAAALITAFFGILGLVASLALSIEFKRKPEMGYAPTESDTKTLPL